MPNDGFWGAMFGGQPATVLDYYNKGAQGLAATRLANIKNALGQIQLNYAPQMAQQAANLGAANVSIKQNEATYAPQMSLADLALKHNQAINEAAETAKTNLASRGEYWDNISKQAEAQGAPAKVKAQIGLIQAQTAQAYGKAQSAASQSAPLAQFNKAIKDLPVKDRMQYIANHADQILPLLSGQLNQISPLTPGGGAPSTSPAQSPVAPQSPGSSISPGMPQVQPPSQGAAPGMPQGVPAVAPQGTPPLPIPQPSADENVKDAFKIAANKNNVSAQAYRRGESSAELESLFQDPIQQRMVKNAASYVGPEGQIKAAYDAIHNPNSQRYNDYLTFHNQLPTQLANVTRFMDGMGVQISTRNELLGNYTDAFNRKILGTPQQALNQWNNMLDVVRNTSRNSLKLAQPSFPGMLEKKMGIDVSGPANHLSNTKSSSNEGMVRMVSPAGKMYNVSQDDAKEATSNGWKMAG